MKKNLRNRLRVGEYAPGRSLLAGLDNVDAGVRQRVVYSWSPTEIREFVELYTSHDYVPGEAFYELTKTEKIDSKAAVIVMDTKYNHFYYGTELKNRLGLTSTKMFSPYQVPAGLKMFVQSRSYNRKLVEGTTVLILK